jgi:hydroxypyruvate reductase 2
MTPPATSADERPLVLLAQPLFPEFAAALSARYRLALAADADAATVAEGRVLLIGIAPVTEEHLAGLPALQLVAGISVGVDHVDLAACRRRGLSVTNAGAAFAVDSADYAVGLVVAVLRRVAAADAYVRGGRWVTDGDYPLTTKVSRSTIFFRKSRGLLSSISRRNETL